MCEEQQISLSSLKSKLVHMASTDPKIHVHSVEERAPPKGAQKHLRVRLYRPHLKSQSARLSVMDRHLNGKIEVGK